MIDNELVIQLRMITKHGVALAVEKGSTEAEGLRECIVAFLEAVKKNDSYTDFKSHFIEVIKLDYPHLVKDMEKFFILF